MYEYCLFKEAEAGVHALKSRTSERPFSGSRASSSKQSLLIDPERSFSGSRTSSSKRSVLIYPERLFPGSRTSSSKRPVLIHPERPFFWLENFILQAVFADPSREVLFWLENFILQAFSTDLSRETLSWLENFILQAISTDSSREALFWLENFILRAVSAERAKMAEESLRRKTRSASICAPGFSSMEQMLEAMPPSGAREREKGERERDSGSGTPEGSTPTRRRRPATRSQSARVSGANKSIRRRAAAQAAAHHHHHHEGTVKSAHCSSEPRLTDNDISPGLRRRGSRRGQSMHHAHQRKSNAFLDVPDTSSQIPPREEGEDEDSYRLRSFSLTSKGVQFDYIQNAQSSPQKPALLVARPLERGHKRLEVESSRLIISMPGVARAACVLFE
ncbi:hypothetical protein KM043_010724 [Ampulex compressa]|nr:hypothetical protein KM043_010724 [Ampulex compressa]